MNFADFVRVVSKKVDQDKFKKDELISAFKKFEGGAPPGMMKCEDLKKLLLKNDAIGEELATQMVNQMEPNPKTNLVNYEKFINFMLSE